MKRTTRGQLALIASLALIATGAGAQQDDAQEGVESRRALDRMRGAPETPAEVVEEAGVDSFGFAIDERETEQGVGGAGGEARDTSGERVGAPAGEDQGIGGAGTQQGDATTGGAGADQDLGTGGSGAEQETVDQRGTEPLRAGTEAETGERAIPPTDQGTAIAIVIFEGEVHEVTPRSIVIREEDDSLTRLAVAEGTQVRKDARVIAIEDLEEGDSVRASFDLIAGENYARSIIVQD